MGLFSFLTGSQKKTNLSPDIQYPSQENMYFTSPTATQGGFNLRDVARKKIMGEGTGFGDDFTDRMSSPGINQIDKNFQNRTMPELSSQASKRGLARSSIVQDQISQADQSRNRDIASMVANFEFLNRQQKKADETQGINLASGLQDQQRSMTADMAASSERQVGRNIAGDQYAQQYKDQAGKNIMAIAASAMGAGAGAGGMGGAPVGLGSQPGIGAISTYGANNIPQGMAGSNINYANNPGGAGSPFFGGSMGNMVGAALGQGGRSGVGTDFLGRLDTGSVSGMSRQQIEQLLRQYYGG